MITWNSSDCLLSLVTLWKPNEITPHSLHELNTNENIFYTLRLFAIAMKNKENTLICPYSISTSTYYLQMTTVYMHVIGMKMLQPKALYHNHWRIRSRNVLSKIYISFLLLYKDNKVINLKWIKGEFYTENHLAYFSHLRSK